MTYFGRVQCWGPLSLAISHLRKGKKKKKRLLTQGALKIASLNFSILLEFKWDMFILN